MPVGMVWYHTIKRLAPTSLDACLSGEKKKWKSEMTSLMSSLPYSISYFTFFCLCFLWSKPDYGKNMVIQPSRIPLYSKQNSSSMWCRQGIYCTATPLQFGIGECRPCVGASAVTVSRRSESSISTSMLSGNLTRLPRNFKDKTMHEYVCSSSLSAGRWVLGLKRASEAVGRL